MIKSIYVGHKTSVATHGLPIKINFPLAIDLKADVLMFGVFISIIYLYVYLICQLLDKMFNSLLQCLFGGFKQSLWNLQYNAFQH